MIVPIVIKAVAVGAVAEVVTLVIAQAVPTDTTAIWVAALGSVTSVVLALINYRLNKRPEHTANSKTDALTTKITSLETLLTVKDAVIAAQQQPSALASTPPVVPMEVKLIDVDIKKPMPVIDKTPRK